MRELPHLLLSFITIIFIGCGDTKNDVLQEELNPCPTQTTFISKGFEGKPVCQLHGTYTSSLLLTNDIFWALKGEVHIGTDNSHNSTLRIEAGTTIFGKTGADFLVITRGSQLIAQGTASAPIIFTSQKDVAGLISKAGDWGGIAIAGNAPINGAGEDIFEFSNSGVKYGGHQRDDSSGALEHVQIRYAGFEVRPGEELNGLSLGGVGSKTTLDYIEVYHGKDDGIELWGGTVNLSHLVLIDNGDDNLDFDQGYQGNIQYVYIRQNVATSHYPRGIESDSNKKEPDSKPKTIVTVANFEIHGSKKTSEAVMSRRGSALTLINGMIHDVEGSGIVVKGSNRSRFHDNHFFNIALCDIKKDLVRDEEQKLTRLDAFNRAYSASITKSCKPSTLKLRSINFPAPLEKTAYIGAYEPGSDWRKEFYGL